MKKKIRGNKKVILIIAGCVLLVAVLALLKAFIINPPKETPRQITQKMVDFMQKKDVTEQDKANIRKYYSQNIIDKFNKDVADTSKSSDNLSGDVVVTIRSIEEQNKTATATVEVETWILKVPIQFKFTKEGNFFKGYKWVISDIIGTGDNSNKKESTGKPDEKIDIGGGFKIIVSKPSDFTPSSSWDKADDGMKYLAVELSYFNESSSSGNVSPSNLTLRDSEGHSYEITYKTEKKPQLESGTVVTAGGTAKGFILYEVPNNANINSAVYSNSDSTVTINF